MTTIPIMPFAWLPDAVTPWQFVRRVKQHLGSTGYIFTPEHGYEYCIRQSVLYRVQGADWQPIGNIHELGTLSDEQLYARCRAS